VVIKPTGDDAGILIAGVAILDLGTAWAASLFRAYQPG
jgi:hypothetical protein